MKKLFYLIAPILGAFAFASCSQTEQDISNFNTVTEVVTQGKWKVDIYLDANMDQTNDFAGYSFTFGKSGSVTATNGSSTFAGTWTENQTDRKLHINFNTSNAVLDKINDTWNIVEINYRFINLNNNNTQNEYLGIGQQ
jgi:hypothetical protein